MHDAPIFVRRREFRYKECAIVAIGLISAPLIAGLISAGYWVYVAAAASVCVLAWMMTYRNGLVLAVLGVATSFVNGVHVVGPFNVPDFFLLPAAVLAISTLIVRRWTLPWWFVAPAAGMVVVGSAAALLNLVPTESLFSLYRFVGLYVLTALVVGVLGSSRRRLTVLALAFLAGAVIHSGLAVADSLGIWHIASDITGSKGLTYSGRVTGLTTHSNLLGLSSAMAIPFALYFAERRKVYYLAIPPLVMGIVASGSRAGMIAALTGAVLYVVLCRRRAVGQVAMIGLALVGAAVVAVQLGVTVGLERLAVDNPTAARADVVREALADHATAEFVSHPLLGVGFGLQQAHILYLELARSGGLVTLILFLIFTWGCLAAGNRLKDLGSTGAAVAAFSTWLIVAVQHNALTDRFLYVPAGLIVAAWLIHRYDREHSTRDDGDPDASTSRPLPEAAGR